MKCEEARLELANLVRSEKADRVRKDVEVHLESCKTCRHEADNIKDTIELVRRAVPALPANDLFDGVMALLLAQDMGDVVRGAVPALPRIGLRDEILRIAAPPAVTRLRSRRGRDLAVAAVAVASIALAVVSWTQLKEAKTPTTGIPVGHETYVFTLTGEVTAEASLVHYRHDNFRLLLSTKGFSPTPPGFQYAVWLRGEDGDVPLGGFRLQRPDTFDVPFAIAVDPAIYPEVLVTLEPIAGDAALNGKVVSSAVMDTSSVHHGKYDR